VKKHWITEILVDLTVTATIICAVLLGYTWLHYIVIGYTILLLLVKFMVVISSQFQAITKKGKSTVPYWVYHLLYALNTTSLLIFSWYVTAIGWLIIWGLSIYISKN